MLDWFRMIRFIAAIDEKRGIADDNGIPWNLPTDQRYFVDQTKTGIILMGYRTYLEFKRPLHGRINYIATSRSEKLRPGFKTIHDVEKFIKQHSGETINNIGGAGLFNSTIKFADELVLTKVHADFNCTKFFPAYENNFMLVSKAEPITENGTSFHYEIWQRKNT